VPKDLEKRLDDLAKRTGRTKSYYARQAIVEHLEDLEDYYLAESRRDEPGENVPIERLMDEVGMARGRDGR
jgi:RHH-type rel operon transcriptional repressor/antitoxin RelB